VNAEIVMIGTELLLGQIVDSNAAHIGQVLAENGINIFQKTTVGDNQARITGVLEASLGRADAVLTSGGLGPTEDDLTRESVAQVFGRKLEYREELYDTLVERFAFLRRPFPENNKKQCYVPEGAVVIDNPHGTAPGFRVGDERGHIICMPGVPFELKAMLRNHVVPFLSQTFGLKGVLQYRVLKVCGVGESRVDEMIGDLMATQANPTIGVLANPEWVRIRIAARADTAQEAQSMIDEVDARVRERLPGLVMGVDDDTLEGVVDELLTERGWTLAVAETLTGGMIGQRLVAAKARSFKGGKSFPVDEFETTDPNEAAVQLADEVRKELNADCGIAIVTNLATTTAVGALVTPEGGEEWGSGFPTISPVIQTRAAVMALERLRRNLTHYEPLSARRPDA
jgi:nicotinamide-nucleotide amidase